MSALFSLFIAGAAIGVLTGLSSAPILAIIITALTGAFSVLIFPVSGGLSVLDVLFRAESDDVDAPDQAAQNSARLAAFALALAVGASVGTYMRTHEVLSPSIETDYATLLGIGFDETLAQRAILAVRYGIDVSDTGVALSAVPGSKSTSLMTASASECLTYSQSRPSDLRDELRDASSEFFRKLAEIEGIEDSALLRIVIDICDAQT